MGRKIFFLAGIVFLLSACQPNISVNYGNSNTSPNANVNSNVNAINNVNAIANINVAPTVVDVISEIKVSDVINTEKNVEVNKTSFTKDTAEIFISVYLKGVTSGTVATAELVYLPSNNKVGPTSNTISSSGDATTNFSFTKPTNGWPVGNFNVDISLSNGQKKTAPFVVQ